MNENSPYKIPEAKDCFGYERFGSTEIRMDNMDSFLEQVEGFRIDKVWSCYAPLCNKFTTADGKPSDFERQNPDPEIFFFVKDNVVYSVESEGFRFIYDYIKAKGLGFLGPKARNLLQRISEKYKGESLALLYYDAIRDGFNDFEEFNESYLFYDEFKPASKYREDRYISRELCFKKMADWEIAHPNGFKNGPDYYNAKSWGIRNSCEYEDFKILHEKMEKYGFDSPFKFHVFHIINRLRGGQSIKLRDMAEKLRDESEYYNRGWYEMERDKITVDLLKDLLSSEKKFKDLGFLANDGQNYTYSLYRSNTIYVDGSNVAWDNGDKNKRDVPQAINIKLMIAKLKDLGFKNVTVICDNNLYWLVPDKEVYTEMSRNGVLYAVKKGTVADEWILRFKDGKDKFIVTCDKYRKYLNEYPDASDHTIGFQIFGDEVLFDKKIDDVLDGVLPESELPELCAQRHL